MKYKITDHAIVRLIERRYHIDVMSLRRQIDKSIQSRVPTPQNGKWALNMADGSKFVFNGNTLVTVISKKRN